MKLLLRVLFYTVLVYASYQLLAGLMQKKPQLPKVLQDYADNAMQQYLCKAPVSWRIGQLDPASFFDEHPRLSFLRPRVAVGLAPRQVLGPHLGQLFLRTTRLS